LISYPECFSIFNVLIFTASFKSKGMFLSPFYLWQAKAWVLIAVVLL